MSFDKPVRHLREYLERARTAVARRAGGVRRRGVPASTPAVTVPGATPFPIVVAALGSQLLKVAGDAGRRHASPGAPGRRRCAAHTIPTITAAAEAAGRPAPRVDRRPAGLRDHRRRTALAPGPPRCSPSTASCRATGRCSTEKVRPARPTSPSSARPTRSAARIGELADLGVDRLRGRRVRCRSRRGGGDPRGVERE